MVIISQALRAIDTGIHYPVCLVSTTRSPPRVGVTVAGHPSARGPVPRASMPTPADSPS